MSPGALIGPIILAVGLVAAAIAFALVDALLATADGGAEARLGRAEAELATLRAEVARLEDAQGALRRDLERAEEERAAAPPPAPSPPSATLPVASFDAPTHEETVGADVGTEAPTEVMLIAKDRFNGGITQPRNRTMLEILGHPRESYSTDCRPVTNPRLKGLLETRDYGSFRVTMIRPALDSLDRIMARLKEDEPDLHDAIGTAGALCVRLIRGSRSSVSNHSWGTAIDVKIEGQLDGFGDGGTQFGLLPLAEAFNDEGWFWGATYTREDSMHFEVGEETLRRWQEEGRL